MRARRSSMFAAALSATTVLTGVSAPAQAAARPSAVLHLASGNLDANALLRVSYSAAHLPRHSSLVLQRTVGTAHAWVKVKVLVASTVKATYAGKAVVRAPQMGSYGYRVLVTTSAHVKVASVGRTLHAFADIPLATIKGTTTGTVQMGANLYRYAVSYYDEFDRNYSVPFLHFDRTTCRRADLTFAGDTYSGGSTLSVIQETADPYTVGVVPNAVVSGSVVLTGGAADFSFTFVQPSALFINGTLSCYTADGKYPTPTT